MNEIEPVFVDEIPRHPEPGKLYISIAYTTAMHLCPCECGNEVVTTLHPARFSLTFDGETVSLHPSVGSSGLPCRSHYFVKKNQIRWCTPLNDQKVATARYRDQRALKQWEASDGRAVPDSEPADVEVTGWKARLRKRARRTA